MKKIEEKKRLSSDWFKSLRNEICNEIEKIENQNSNNNAKFKKTKWFRDKKGSKNLGGGEISLLRGKIFEKAGVNISTVYGKFSEKFRKQIPGTKKKMSFGHLVSL